MLTVLQIIPSLGAGGAEQACVDVALGLKAAGHRAIVVSSGGMRVTDIEGAGGWHVTKPVDSKNPVTMAANAKWLEQFIKDQQVDIVHVRSRAPAWSALRAARAAGRPFVTTFHAAYKHSNPFKKFYNSVMTKGDRVIAISDFIADHIRKTYGTRTEKIRTIPRGINLNRFSPEKVLGERQTRLRQTWDIDDNRRIILLPARLSPIKGQKTLIEAMSLLPPSLADAVAVILGDDQGRIGYRNELQYMINSRELEDRVRIVAHCDDMPAAYRISSLVVSPSVVPEGFGRVPVEAMAMGVPVIASDIGGYRETMDHGRTGWLISPENPRQLADAIARAFQMSAAERAAMTEAGLQKIHALYDKRKMVTDTLAVYEELVHKNRP